MLSKESRLTWLLLRSLVRFKGMLHFLSNEIMRTVAVFE